MALLNRLADRLMSLVALVLPMFARARDVRRLGRTALWVIHAIVLTLILIALRILNAILDIDHSFLWPGAPDVVKAWFLPLLFCSLYALCWVIWYLYQLLIEPPPPSDFPDIDQAWDEILLALDRAGVALKDTPLYLVLGRPVGPEEDYFQAQQLQLKLHFIPNRSDSPLHVYANREVIYVSCAGASLLGRQCALLAGEANLPDARGELHGPSADEIDPDKTLGLGGGDGAEYATVRAGENEKLLRISEILRKVEREGRRRDELTAEERAEIEHLIGESGPRPEASRQLLHRSLEEVDRYTARLRHLCRLMVRDRRPLCPINGILVLTPLAAAAEDDMASEVGKCCEEDLAAAHEELRMICPVLFLMVGLEELPGFSELIIRLPKAQWGRRLGQRFPVAPILPTARIHDTVEGAVRWIGNAFFPGFVHTLWHIEGAGAGEEAKVTAGNSQLFRLAMAIRTRQERMSRIILQAIEGLPREPLMFAGCYLTGIERSSGRAPVFFKGVHQRLISDSPTEQLYDRVYWTPDAIREDAGFTWWARAGYVATGIVAVSALAAWIYREFSGGP